MNWMGGNLSRHRRGKGWKEEMARQKEYFAKARSRQRQQEQSRPSVTLSAADFVPNYTSPAKKPTASLQGAEASPSSMLCDEPVPAAPEVLTSLGDWPKIPQRDVPKLPIAFPLGDNDRPPLSEQAGRDRSIGASGPEAGFRRLLRSIDSAGTEMPRRPALQSRREREYSTIFRHTSERQQRLGGSSGHRKSSGGGRPRDNRKRKLRQATPSPRSIRIRVGSRDYRWSKSRNSIETPAYYGQRSPTQITAPENPRSRMQSVDVNGTPHLIDEGLTGSSSSSSYPPLSSPCRSRASRLRELHNSTSHIIGPTSAEFERPLPDYDCGSAPKSPSSAPSASDIDSTDSTAVQASDDGHMPESEMDEERIWRQWLEG
ncbi:hypothetical protein CCMA1212_001186 [Trichoderma ghanense]|uniref:Uncharacterized protein n=1 Tax=Trichoderma ghanense TaxID=65468 RepID=A0ABY2HGP9_9HYPO